MRSHVLFVPSALALSVLSLFLVVSVAAPSIVYADSWVDISDSLEIRVSNPIRSRRSKDARIMMSVSNISEFDFIGPVRLVLNDLKPWRVAIDNATGETEAGDAYIDLAPYVGDVFDSGEFTGRIELTVTNGGRIIFNFEPSVEQSIERVY